MKITKRWLKKWRPCREAIDWLNEQDIKDVFKLIKRLRQSDINDKYGWLFWAIPRLLKTHRDRVRFAVYAAWLVLPEFEKECPDDKRPRETLSLVKKWLKNPGNVSDGELRHAAWAAWAAEAAEAAAEAAVDPSTFHDTFAQAVAETLRSGKGEG